MCLEKEQRCTDVVVTIDMHYSGSPLHLSAVFRVRVHTLILLLLLLLPNQLLPPVSDLVFLDVVECHALVALIALDFAIGAVPFVSENALSESDCSEIASRGVIFAGDVEIQQLKKHRLSSVGAN